jgi:monofunctional biosynthetic peptidoglycan transglycosylase
MERFQAFARSFANWIWHGDGTRRPWLRRTLAIAFAFLVPIPILLILLFRFAPVPGTPQMLFSFVTGHGAHYSWRSDDSISPYLGRAVISSEDQRFCSHHGFDWKDIHDAVREHERHPRKQLRGASTISQQTARSLFLLPVRSWIRKGMEAYLTVLLEAFWPKERILTIYLNVVDWGHGNFGAEAASEAYFHKPASRLTSAEAARLAAVLPDPEKWHADTPGPYVAGRTETIGSKMGEVTRDSLDACVRN